MVCYPRTTLLVSSKANHGAKHSRPASRISTFDCFHLSLKYEDSLIKKKLALNQNNFTISGLENGYYGTWVIIRPVIILQIQPSAANFIWMVIKSLMYLLRVHQPYQYLVLWNFPLGLANILKRHYFFPFFIIILFVHRNFYQAFSLWVCLHSFIASYNMGPLQK